ncbi:MAG: glycosyltransferase family 4 protein [Hamadaea sp.]|nr:glycosyltransferase family 4 protein [Hamadaea sp.]NUR51966.1 glycosyltransferase family 4 protein [Hamadaea sp.]NUT08781.1 glycosyltransferase family 4 protein [Hamadaea sp.]
MRILCWHVHGSWMTAFVQGEHEYLIPVTPDRGPDGRGRARTFTWPDNAVELTPEELARADIDCVVLQRPEELELLRQWLPGRRFPLVYVEHNTPRGDVPLTRHPLADRSDVLIVHVTHFNDLFWDCGHTARTVIEHGIPDPGRRYSGDLARLGVVINEPVRRGRVTGTDLLTRFAAAAPLDVFGIGAGALPPIPGITTYDDPPQAEMHRELARRRAYLHPMRWTSLGLSLIEAMAMGQPVIGLATTEAVDAVPAAAGVLSTNVDTLVEAARWLTADADSAARLGAAGRQAYERRFTLGRFLADWDRTLKEVCEL